MEAQGESKIRKMLTNEVVVMIVDDDEDRMEDG